MDKQQARKLIKQTFEQPFEKTRFTTLIKNLLNRCEEAPLSYKGQYIPDAYKPYISALDRIGKFHDGEHAVDILVIKLKKETSLERARTMQRNFVAWYLNGSRGDKLKDAALVAFVSPEETDWRFSLVKMDYRFEQTKTGKMKVKEEFTPARRWSFLVGTNEQSHTAQSRLINLLANDEQTPTLAELEEAFNIETVTTEFFLKYRDLFIRTKEALDRVVRGDPRIEAEFEAKQVNTVDFAKKLLGQIVFLYFLQKKGWFGVGRDAPWGTGSRQFLRELFEQKHGRYGNFFDDILEPLFYEALRNDRSHDDDYYSRFNCKIPFLNGGLFDPIDDYDWVHTNINLPDSLFSNQNRTAEGDIGDGILDIFDRYNFTVKEDEPLEKEVAIDPELLGKAYEKFNAIRPDNFEEYKQVLRSGKKGDENKFNKQFGVYYTPREIVHYMCRQSLINYLHTELGKDIVTHKKLFEKQTTMFGNQAKRGQLDCTIEYKLTPQISRKDIETLIHLGEQVSANEARVENKGKETVTYSYKLPESIRKNAGPIDRKLADITVCDPAVGSGAFPVGMMTEIVRTRNVLSTFIQEDKPTPYDLKRRCIEHSLYGVDIDAGAVEIAKLRLWLSLIVDEDDIKNIKPLPNLEYKIVCGDSLLGYPYKPMGLDEVEKLKEQFLEEVNPKRKKELRNRIDAAIYGLFKNTEKSLGYQVTMDFRTNFSEVFRTKGGFDVVVANPPYVRQEAIRHLKPKFKKIFKDFYCGTADIYTYFYKCGVDLLKSNGHLCFIAPNKFMRASYGKNTRTLLTTRATPRLVIDFGDLPIFDATTYPSILLIEKRKPDGRDKAVTATFTDASQLAKLEDSLLDIAFLMPVKALSKEGWNLERSDVLSLMEKLKKIGVPLGEYIQGRFYRGVLTGLNKAFVIDAATRERLIAEDPASADVIKPWLRGRDIRKWKAEWAGLYVINIASSSNKTWPWSNVKTEAEAVRQFEETYPAIYRHLAPWEKELQKRDDQGKFWWELRSCAYYEAFEGTKIIYPDISQASKFSWDQSNSYLGNTVYMIPTDKLWLVGLLNSKFIWWYYSNITSTIRGGFVRFFSQYMETIPISLISDSQKTSIIERTRAILAAPGSPAVPTLEAEIDQIVYVLYNLTPEEIRIVEGVN
ncbi:Eco57I restriction-modification methylase domain-containing protein [Syntrophobacter fumaroxidans]|uniref:site-specific DNA-methyltransferase (adenine-specific) n=1 Tax=Syntrophobacter fumaroxidans (strain DSM 10017 / MPOB) TaxID=335543 RepID=A0LFA8_SYNFM|nr:TaqI-like C-terminal specificity domain-containing protein [Syntrophobacter fumaroxidans]ABK16110.1 hypothetical protein Sfum_0410 [Syntrophobacter fumaroxidans MPOB]